MKSDEILVTVHDNGIGMKPEVLNMLFDKTAPYTTRGTANEKGTGLGLILCKEFVEKNGGRIWVESEEDKGSTFYFTLPKGS
jgi:signal transduction histidine kinase